MSDIRIEHQGRTRTFGPDHGVVTVGRSDANDVVVDDPTVSRHHAHVSWDGRAWTWTDLAGGRTFIGGRSVTSVALSGRTTVSLASPAGPGVGVETSTPVGAARTQPAAATGGPTRAHAYGWSPMSKDEMKGAFEILLPVKSWLSNPGWNQRLRLAVIPYALLPSIFLALYVHTSNLSTPGWLYALYVAPLWAFAFWLLIRPGALGRRELFTAAGVIAFGQIWTQIVTIKINDSIGHFEVATLPDGSQVRFPAPLSIVDALGVGFNEEITKALPVLIAAVVLLKWRHERLSPRMWMFIGTLSGLAFGVAEAANYTSQYLVNIAGATNNNGAVDPALLFADRIFVDGLQHALWAGIAGFFIGMALTYPKRRVELVVFAVTVPAVLHGLNDWTAPHIWLQIGVQALSVLLFIGYTMSARSIERQVRQSKIFRGESLAVDDLSTDTESDAKQWGPVLADDVKALRRLRSHP